MSGTSRSSARSAGVLFLAFSAQFAASGFVLYTFGALLDPIAASLGGGRFEAACAVFAAQLGTGLASPLVGRLLDRVPASSLMLGGACLYAGGLLGAAAATNHLQLFLAMALLAGPGIASLGVIPSATLVSRSFTKRRGLALGVSAMGISCAGIVMAPVAVQLERSFGWRTTLTVYAVILGVFALAMLAWRLRYRAGAPPKSIAATPMRLRLDGRIVFLAALIGINLCVVHATLIHLIPLLSDTGLSAVHASFAFAGAAFAGATAKPIFGRVADRIGAVSTLFTSMAIQCAGITLLMFASGPWATTFAAVLFGLGMGGVVPLWGAIVAANWPLEQFGRAMGAMAPIVMVFQLAGAPLTGMVHDRAGTYRPALIAFLALYAVAGGIAILWMRRQGRQTIAPQPVEVTPVLAPIENETLAVMRR